VIIGKRIRVRGQVQGVGFRPTVWHLAKKQNLTGQVLNDGEGVLIDIWGEKHQCETFVVALEQQAPPLSRIDKIETEQLHGNADIDFQIIESQHTSSHTGVVADAASCSHCISETLDVNNRRFRYPFTNCTHCGPRLSIIDGVPYDRVKTSMAKFPLCPECEQEYQNPADRRFHAQPNACPLCGPMVKLIPEIEDNSELNELDELETAALLLKQGQIIAIKGIGGFHLACDATNEASVKKLRKRKHRYAKPFALMARNIANIKNYCCVSLLEEELLVSSEAPIVILDRLQATKISAAVAPNLKVLGMMLPYTPLHHLLLKDIDFPIVMTSGNQSDAPQCIDNQIALNELDGIADYWLTHNREIRNRVDDSVARVVAGKTRLLRRARGFAPASLPLPEGFEQSPDILAFGGELKNTFCMIKDGQAILAQHMGDLKNVSTFIDYKHNLNLYKLLFAHQPITLVVDAHPEYLSSKTGSERAQLENLELIKVQHHHAHIAACLAENTWPKDAGKVLGIALDGTGLGDDQTIWGGEFLLADYCEYQRLGCLKPVALLGGAQAMAEPWRNTYSHLLSIMSWEKLSEQYSDLELITRLNQKPITTLNTMLEKKLNSPLASSCGRLFDAVAAAINVCFEQQYYEGQAAMELEALVEQKLIEIEFNNAYPFSISLQQTNNLPCLDAATMWHHLLDDLQSDTSPAVIATRFHQGLANGIGEMTTHLYLSVNEFEHKMVALSGGVFQNRTLFLMVRKLLLANDYQVLTHADIPANDGGIAFGQAVVALAQIP